MIAIGGIGADEWPVARSMYAEFQKERLGISYPAEVLDSQFDEFLAYGHFLLWPEGFAICVVNNEKGIITDVYVAPEHRGQRLTRCYYPDVIRHLEKQGCRRFYTLATQMGPKDAVDAGNRFIAHYGKHIMLHPGGYNIYELPAWLAKAGTADASKGGKPWA